MPKIKTNRSAAKRFRITGSGRIIRRRAFHSHLLSGKTRDRKRKLLQSAIIDLSDRKRVKRMLGI